MTLLRTKPFVRTGFTMIEATISVAILGILLVVALQVVGASTRNQYQTAQRLTAAALAQSFINDIIQLPYQDPGSIVNFGIEPGESLVSKANYDDVDDFNNWTESPPQDRTGTPMTDLAGWTRSVAVTWVNPANLAQTSVTESGLKRITVTVFKGGVVLATRSALRGKYP
jgi:prepilin-type N-terminal cleavage/methylation domain-containing protein